MSLQALQAAASRKGAALVAVVEVEGSTPRGVGSKMAVFADGGGVGTVGGGKVEAVAIERAVALLAALAAGREEGGALELDLDLTGRETLGETAICGGRVRLLLAPVRDPEALKSALSRLERGERSVLVFGSAKAGGLLAVLDAEGKPQAGSLPAAGIGFDRDAALAALGSGKPSLGPVDGFLYDPILPAEKLLILGAGHVGRALALMAPLLGFEVTVGDPRQGLADPGRFPPEVTVLAEPFERILAEYPFDASTYAIVVSPGHLSDLDCVRAILAREYRYAGFIGSRRKVRMVLEE
ncbi:MAG: XdhC family protein, partial [Spirochaetaceae bacterium]|nr:XdhC family protein [Spirochaetaceae bacterium]